MKRKGERRVYIRPSWDETFMTFAVVASKRVMCIFYKVGAVITKDKQVLSIGYNGPVIGEPHCEHAHVGCAKLDKKGNKLPAGSGKCRGAHAEINAISNSPVNVKDSTLYVTFRPCLGCAKQIINAGIKRVVYLNDYDGEEQAIELLEKSEIALIKFSKISQMDFGGGEQYGGKYV